MPRYGCDFDGDALERIRALPEDVRLQIGHAIRALQEDPHPRGCRLMAGSRGSEREFRIRVGDYRVIYTVRGTTLWIVGVGHRSKIYRRRR